MCFLKLKLFLLPNLIPLYSRYLESLTLMNQVLEISILYSSGGSHFTSIAIQARNDVIRMIHGIAQQVVYPIGQPDSELIEVSKSTFQYIYFIGVF